MNSYLVLISLVAATNFIALPRDAKARETKTMPDDITIQMIEIAPTNYQLGDDNGFWDARPAHDVRISHGYRVAVRAVSNAQYESLDPNHKATRAALQTIAKDDDSVRFVTWQQATNYCAWLSERTGKIYRLPTEAEWELAFATYSADLELGRIKRPPSNHSRFSRRRYLEPSLILFSPSNLATRDRFNFCSVCFAIPSFVASI